MSADSSAFYRLPVSEREDAMRRACDRYGAENFFDLDPAQRGEAYREALALPAGKLNRP